MKTERSANEVYATTLKAGRGAGMPVAQAALLARFMARMVDDQVLGAVLDALRAPAATPALSDGALLNAHPVRDLPQLAELGQALTAQMTHWSEVMAFYAAWLGLDVRAGDDGMVELTPNGPRSEGATRRAVLSDALWSELEALAALTFVPETDESRAGGAGAGLTDND